MDMVQNPGRRAAPVTTSSCINAKSTGTNINKTMVYARLMIMASMMLSLTMRSLRTRTAADPPHLFEHGGMRWQDSFWSWVSEQPWQQTVAALDFDSGRS